MNLCLKGPGYLFLTWYNSMTATNWMFLLTLTRTSKIIIKCKWIYKLAISSMGSLDIIFGMLIGLGNDIFLYFRKEYLTLQWSQHRLQQGLMCLLMECLWFLWTMMTVSHIKVLFLHSLFTPLRVLVCYNSHSSFSWCEEWGSKFNDLLLIYIR